MSEMIQRANRGVNQRDDIVGIDEDVGAIVVTFKLSNWASMKARKENKSRKGNLTYAFFPGWQCRARNVRAWWLLCPNFAIEALGAIQRSSIPHLKLKGRRHHPRISNCHAPVPVNGSNVAGISSIAQLDSQKPQRSSFAAWTASIPLCTHRHFPFSWTLP
ncbi:hypothetical protein I7I50_03829 [Histoplasma capsulatum G186AR]|uniref:Uncharacterized protein n=1 Tax=Ajellomyces capsulatus TaxID=5037 RepID=A0A8H8CXK1_AJECA|nr:hypothetical protein I7I52_04737 [Histoplasma capsulatum]QSS74882.1 hypothetical protein I7I50_03829 [Histoplasma capsulatum G186AR]